MEQIFPAQKNIDFRNPQGNASAGLLAPARPLDLAEFFAQSRQLDCGFAGSGPV
jgi:hypothetical protein